ncbi:MAG: choice-of-anchor D domain-containing protein [Planctomycetota bacterium]|nr:choice-of-anchor D domain-containing protein [Planctomycetota bacterium]
MSIGRGKGLVGALLLLLVLCASSASAQLTVEVLTGQTETSYTGTGNEFNTWWHDCRTESLYLASELMAAGAPGAAPISAIAFKCSELPGKNLENLRIRIKHTTATSVTTGWQTGFTQVYGPTTLAPSAFTVGGWYTFTFTTPFMWDGSSNLVIDYTIDGTSYVTGGGAYRRELSTARSKYGYSDSGYSWDFSGMTSYTRNNVPSMRITFDGLSITTPSNLPTAAEQTAYSTNIQATMGTTPYTWSFISGTLPPGLSLAQVGNAYNLSGTPNSGTAGNYTFTVRVTDAVSDTYQKQMSVYVAPPPAAMPFTDDFSTDKGWQVTGGWSRGTAVAYSVTGSATGPNRSEPGTDNTSTADNMIIGHNRGADYANGMGASEWAVSPPVNCTGVTNVRLKFYRWLGVSPNDECIVQVTNNGSTWTNVYVPASGSTVNDTAWTLVYYDISAVAAGNPVVQVRFGVGPTDGSIQNVGWCIDDFTIEEPGPDMEVREGGVSGTVITDNEAVGGQRDFGQVNVSTQSNPLTIAVSNMGPNSISFPSGITKTGSDPTDFYINAGGFPASLAVGQTATFTIVFYRQTVGVSTATINLEHNASGSGTTPFEINVRGEAIQPVPVIEVRLTNSSGTIIPHQDPATGTIRDFGNQDISAGPTAPITICIVNSGTGALGLGTPDMAGTWWDQYVVTSSMPSSIAPGASATFTVAFDPSSIGVKDAYVRIPHTDGTKPSPYQVPVLGNGTSPGPSVNVTEGAGGPSVAHNAAASGGRDFGNQLVTAGPTAPLTIVINNTGTSDLTVGTPVLGGADPGEFVLNTATIVSPVTPGNSTSFTIAFDPTSIGQKNATVSFTHNDTSTPSPFIINVTGNGTNTSGIATVRATNGSGAVLPNPAPATGILNFGDWDYNSGPTAAAVIYVENTGTGPLTLGTPTLAGTNPGEFQLQTAGFAGTIAIGASATFSITFDPTSVGAKTATVQFTHDDPTTGSPYVLNVTGNGILNSPLISVREGSAAGANIGSGDAAVAGGGRDCGSIDVSAGATAPITIFIVNNGTLDLNLGTPTLAGPNAGSFALSLSGYVTSVAPGASATIGVTFDPTLGGIKDAQIEFTQDDSTQPSPYIVKVMGTAIDPSGVTITTTSLPAGTAGAAYGPVQLNAVQGTTPYTWSVYSGTMPAGLTLSPTGEISGTPQGFGGQFKVTVRVTDAGGATDEQLYTIGIAGALTGRGIAKSSGCSAGSGSGPAVAILALLALIAFGVRFHRRQAE